ncbi:hypothetical protein BH10PSE11_BH10PSE11_19450 [soil metagenome]
MKKVILAGVAAVAIIGSTAVYAQHRHHHQRMTTEDRAAFADAKIASVKAGLQLTPDQEKLWPPVETAVRDFAKQRIALANARASERDARRAERDQKGSQDRGPGASADQPKDPVAGLRDRADRMAQTAAGLKKIADAADPLYKSLDDSQKRRLTMLTRMGGHHGWRGRGFERGLDGDRFDRDRGPGRGHGAGDSERL